MVPVQPKERVRQSGRSRRSVPGGRTPLEQSHPKEAAFEVGRTAIDGQEKRSILARPLRPHDLQGDRAARRVARGGLRAATRHVAGAGRRRPVPRRHLRRPRTTKNCCGSTSIRSVATARWFTARLDLSAYEGRQVKLIFNTDPGPTGAHDSTNDLAVWGEPRVYSKR